MTSQNVPRAIAETAEKYHITQVVMGESQRSRWKLLLQGSFPQQLMQLIRDKNIDLHIIATNNKSPK
jgi:two-component system sensor histidine kinase KdpD